MRYRILACLLCSSFTVEASALVQGSPPNADTHRFAWSFHAGETRYLTWKTEIQCTNRLDGIPSAGLDYFITDSASLKIDEIKPDGSAIGNLIHHKIVMHGLMSEGKNVDILVEDGVIKSPAGAHSDAANALAHSWTIPQAMSVAATGEVKVDLNHPIVKVLGAPGTALGPILSKEAVALGGNWETELDAHIPDTPNNLRFKANNRFSELIEYAGRKCASIHTVSKNSYEYAGFVVSFEMVGDSVFDWQRGACLSMKTLINFNGSSKDNPKKREIQGTAKYVFEQSFPEK